MFFLTCHVFFVSAENSVSKMYWPDDEGELTETDRLKADTPTNQELSLGRDTRGLSDDRGQDAMTTLLPSLPHIYTHPHRGEF